MKHPLVPSIEVLGALPLSYLNHQSIYGNNLDPIVQIETYGRATAHRYEPEFPSPIFFVNRLPRKCTRPDCTIRVGFIAAWATRLGVAQGVFLEDLEDALALGRLAMKGLHSIQASLFRAASITKWNSSSETDDQSIVVDAEAIEWRPGIRVQWSDPIDIRHVKHWGP